MGGERSSGGLETQLGFIKVYVSFLCSELTYNESNRRTDATVIATSK